MNNDLHLNKSERQTPNPINQQTGAGSKIPVVSRQSILVRLGLMVLTVAILLFAGTWMRPTTVTEALAHPVAIGQTGLRPGDFNFTLAFGGRNRSFRVHVPRGYNGQAAVPLVLDLHGFTSSAQAQSAISGFRQKSDEVGFIVAFPQGVGNSWNGYGCCGTGNSQNIDDVGFLKAVVARIASMGNIDRRRVYITGLSNGGFMSHRAACEAADVFAAAAPVSAPLNRPSQCRPARPITVVHFHGLRDRIVSYNGGLFQSAQASFASWKNINGCIGSPEVLDLAGRSQCETFISCTNGVQTGLCSLDGSHVLYGSQSALDIADYAWDNVFSRHMLPQ